MKTQRLFATVAILTREKPKATANQSPWQDNRPEPEIVGTYQTYFGPVGQVMIGGELFAYPLEPGNPSDAFYRTSDYQDSIPRECKIEAMDY